MLETSPPLAIGSRCDRAKPVGMAKFGERLARKGRCAMRLACAVLVVNRQLLVCFKAFAGISEQFFPQIARKLVIALALCEARKRPPRRAVRFWRQLAGDRPLVKLPRTKRFAAPLADARDAEKFKCVLAVRLRVAEQ